VAHVWRRSWKRVLSGSPARFQSHFIRRREWFYKVFRENEDNVISSLCQFDFLQCIHAINESDDASADYPSFGIYYNSRTEPILSKIIEDNQAREALLPPMPDDRLARIVKTLDEKTEREFVAFNGWDATTGRTPRCGLSSVSSLTRYRKNKGDSVGGQGVAACEHNLPRAKGGSGREAVRAGTDYRASPRRAKNPTNCKVCIESSMRSVWA
jgi:hypothetical protein